MDSRKSLLNPLLQEMKRVSPKLNLLVKQYVKKYYKI